jgi:hypothetical protein
MLSDSEPWTAVKARASQENSWFLPDFIDRSAKNIATAFLQEYALTKFTEYYNLQNIEGPPGNQKPKKVGIVMAGNIPLVGFHDLLCVFITRHKAMIKTSSKDDVLIKHLVDVLDSWNKEAAEVIAFSEMLKACDAYIATGSNNTAGYFEYYFAKYPHIIRRNRTSVAILSGKESEEELSQLADDVYQYFGLGCRNITKLYVPEGYDFVPLLTVFKKYNYLADHNKYKNNYDYNLALQIMNNKFYRDPELSLSLGAAVSEPAPTAPMLEDGVHADPPRAIDDPSSRA